MPKQARLTGSPSMPRPHGNLPGQRPLGVGGAATATKNTASVRVHEMGEAQREYNRFMDSNTGTEAEELKFGPPRNPAMGGTTQGGFFDNLKSAQGNLIETGQGDATDPRYAA